VLSSIYQQSVETPSSSTESRSRSRSPPSAYDLLVAANDTDPFSDDNSADHENNDTTFCDENNDKTLCADALHTPTQQKCGQIQNGCKRSGYETPKSFRTPMTTYHTCAGGKNGDTGENTDASKTGDTGKTGDDGCNQTPNTAYLLRRSRRSTVIATT